LGTAGQVPERLPTRITGAGEIGSKKYIILNHKKMDSKIIPIRHGDLVFVPIAKIPRGLKKDTTGILLQTGSSGHPHSYKAGTFYPRVEGDYNLGYLNAKNTKLYHFEHGDTDVGGLREAELPDDKYEVRRQVEQTQDGMRPVMD
jgi:hypothetical protein